MLLHNDSRSPSVSNTPKVFADFAQSIRSFRYNRAMLKYWFGFLMGMIFALPLAAEERVRVEPLSGLPQTLRIAPASPQTERSAMEIWLTDFIRAVNFSRPDVFYVSSRQWLEYAAQYETEEFSSKFRKRAEYVKKGELEFQEAIKTGGLDEQLFKEGKLVLDFPANYGSLTNKPPLTEIFFSAVDKMGDGYHIPQLNDCGEEYGCRITIHFVRGSLVPEGIDVGRMGE